MNHGTLSVVSERVMVLVDGGPASGRAVRRAAALAGTLHAALVALVPPSECISALPFDRARDLREALDVPVELGVRTAQLAAVDPVASVATLVRELGGTHLFVPHAPAGGLEGLRRRPLAERLAGQLPDIDIHLVSFH